MAGLPKKYAKMGFKKGWRAYKAAKRKPARRRRAAAARPKRRRAPARTTTRRRTTRTVTARRRTRTAAKRAPRRRKRTTRRGFDIRRAFTGRAAQRTAKQLGAGVGGAVGSAVVIRAIPRITAQARSWTQMLAPAALMFALPRKFELSKIACAGASLAGAFSIVKTNFPQFPLMAGECSYMGVNTLPRSYRRPIGARRTIADATGTWAEKRKAAIMQRPSAGGRIMGLNKAYGSTGALMGGAGYGREFVTPADL